MDTVGKILPSGKIEKEYFGQGFVYKNFDAFNNKTDEICYVSEHDSDVISEGVGHKYKDFVRIGQEFIDSDEDVKAYCKRENVSAEGIAEQLFEMVDWQSPETLICDWENSGAYTDEH